MNHSKEISVIQICELHIITAILIVAKLRHIKKVTFSVKDAQNTFKFYAVPLHFFY